MVVINWFYLTILSISKVSLSDPSHWVMMTKTSLEDLWEGLQSFANALPMPCLFRFFPLCNNIFPVIHQFRFFYSRVAPDFMCKRLFLKEALSLGQKLVKRLFYILFAINFCLYNTRPSCLKTMTRQPKLMQILCNSIYLFLDKYFIQAIQLTCFRILKPWFVFTIFQTLPCISSVKQLK